MAFDFTVFWAQIQETFVGLVNRLPAFIFALVVLALFYILARRLSKWAKSLVSSRSTSENAATVTSLIARWAIVALGALVALSVALPSFEAADLIQVLGISSVAVGFAFRDIFQNFLLSLCQFHWRYWLGV